jgi:hypothetical protein
VAVHTHELLQDSPVTFAKVESSVTEKFSAHNLRTTSQTNAKKRRTTMTPRHNMHSSHLSFISPLLL